MNWDDLNSEKSYSNLDAYFQSKLANVLFSKELQRRLDEEGADVKVVSVHPGLVRTEVSRYVEEALTMKLFMIVSAPVYYFFSKSPLQGAQTTLYCALEDQKKLIGGGYYGDCKISSVNPLALGEENSKKLWKVSEELIGSKINTRSTQ